MRFSIISALLPFALAANASFFNKRDVTGPSLACANAVSAEATQGLTAKSAIGSFTTSSGYIGFLTIISQLSTFESKASSSKTNCCAISGTISEEDAISIDTELGELVDAIVGVLDNLRIKKPIFDSIGLATSTVKTHIQQICTDYDTLSGCLHISFPGDIHAYNDQNDIAVDMACNAASAVYT